MHADDARAIRLFAIDRAKKHGVAVRLSNDQEAFDRNAWLGVAVLAGADPDDLAAALGVYSEDIRKAADGVRNSPVLRNEMRAEDEMREEAASS